MVTVFQGIGNGNRYNNKNQIIEEKKQGCHRFKNSSAFVNKKSFPGRPLIN